MVRRLSILSAVLAGIAATCAPTAFADPAPGTCEYDAATKTATYAWPSSYQSSDLPLIQRVGDDIKVGRTTSRDCPGATVVTTDVIRILGSPPNATGSTPDDIVLAPHNPLITAGGAALKIEFVGVAANRKVRLRINGSTRDDAIVVGELGVNFNADEPTPEVDMYVLDGVVKRPFGIQVSNMGCSTSLCSASQDPGTIGNDFLSTQGGFGTGGPAYQDLIASGVLLGGEGEDHLAATNWTSVNGGPGNDDLDGPGTPGNRARVRFDTAPGPVTVDLAVTAPQNTGDGVDTITGFGAVYGSRFADTIYGNDDDNGLDGGSLFSSDQGDRLEGRGGDDTLSGGPGDDTLLGGAGEDTLDGSAGSDTIEGGEDDDTLYGDVGTSAGQDGDDVLRGGSGDDRMVPARGTDIVDGGSDSDTISFAYVLSGVTYDMAITTQQDTGGGGLLTATGVENVSTSNYSDTIYGDDGPNRVTTLGDHFTTPKPPNRDVVDLRGGDDYLSAFSSPQGVTALGGPGDDTLWGGNGPDSLDGGPGADSVWARQGDDTLAGPADGVKDTLRCDEGNDTVTSYDDGLDVLQDCEVGTPATPPAPPAPAPVAPAPPAPAPPAPLVPAAVTPTPPTPVTPATPPVVKLPASLLDAPKSSTKTCLSRRSFTITLKQKKGVVYRRAVVTLKAGKKQIVRRLTPRTVRVKVKSKAKSKRKTRTVKKTQVSVSLTGLPKGTFTVEIEVTAQDGAVLTGKRTYRTCAKKRQSTKKNKL